MSCFLLSGYVSDGHSPLHSSVPLSIYDYSILITRVARTGNFVKDVKRNKWSYSKPRAKNRRAMSLLLRTIPMIQFVEVAL